jgi:transposase-like protein
MSFQRIVEESLQPGLSVSCVARQHGVAPNLLFRWRKRMGEGGGEAMRNDGRVVADGELRRLEERIRELEQQLGHKTLEVELLEEALAKTGAKKTDLAHQLVADRRFLMKLIADTLQVARSNLRPPMPPDIGSFGDGWRGLLVRHGVPMPSRSVTGTATSFASASSSTPTIARRSAGECQKFRAAGVDRRGIGPPVAG